MMEKTQKELFNPNKTEDEIVSNVKPMGKKAIEEPKDFTSQPLATQANMGK